MKEKDDVKFRIEVAAKVLERAASKTNDNKLRERLLDFARRLRSFEVADYERERTVNEIVNEIREFVWKGVGRGASKHNIDAPLLKPVDVLERRIEELVKSFERKLEKIDEILRMIP